MKQNVLIPRNFMKLVTLYGFETYRYKRKVCKFYKMVSENIGSLKISKMLSVQNP